MKNVLSLLLSFKVRFFVDFVLIHTLAFASVYYKLNVVSYCLKSISRNSMEKNTSDWHHDSFGVTFNFYFLPMEAVF